MIDPKVFLKLDVEYMQHSMIRVLSEYHADVENAVKQACSNFIATGQLQQELDKAFREAVVSEVNSYFRYGEGREAIQAAVNKGLSNLAKKKVKK